MITIAEALGKEYKDIELEDDALTTGGIAHQGETLGEFMEDDIHEEDSIGKLQKSLKECGIKQIQRQMNMYMNLYNKDSGI